MFQNFSPNTSRLNLSTSSAILQSELERGWSCLVYQCHIFPKPLWRTSTPSSLETLVKGEEISNFTRISTHTIYSWSLHIKCAPIATVDVRNLFSVNLTYWKPDLIVSIAVLCLTYLVSPTLRYCLGVSRFSIMAMSFGLKGGARHDFNSFISHTPIVNLQHQRACIFIGILNTYIANHHTLIQMKETGFETNCVLCNWSLRLMPRLSQPKCGLGIEC